mgnify:CR=1 FL=1
MGYGYWDDNTYLAGKTFRAARGVDDFGYTDSLRSRPRSSWKADPTLKAQKRKKATQSRNWESVA